MMLRTVRRAMRTAQTIAPTISHITDVLRRGSPRSYILSLSILKSNHNMSSYHVMSVFMKIIGHFRWLGPNVRWEISQIWIEYIKVHRTNVRWIMKVFRVHCHVMFKWFDTHFFTLGWWQGIVSATLKLPKFFHIHGDFLQKWHFAHPKISFARPELPFLAKSMWQG